MTTRKDSDDDEEEEEEEPSTIYKWFGGRWGIGAIVSSFLGVLCIIIGMALNKLSINYGTDIQCGYNYYLDTGYEFESECNNDDAASCDNLSGGKGWLICLIISMILNVIGSIMIIFIKIRPWAKFVLLPGMLSAVIGVLVFIFTTNVAFGCYDLSDGHEPHMLDSNYWIIVAILFELSATAIAFKF